MTIRFVTLLVSCGLVVGMPLPTLAQDPGRVEVSGGYQLLGGEGDTLPLGWYADVAASLTPIFSIVGSVAGSYEEFDNEQSQFGVSTDIDGRAAIHIFMGGVRLSSRSNQTLVPFAHFLGGVGRASGSVTGTVTFGGQTETIDESFSSTEPAIMAGGGVNIRVTENAWIRAGADWVHVFADGGGGNLYRVTGGVVFSF